MNGAVIWLAFTIGILAVLLLMSIRATRSWIKACQAQVDKRWHESLPVDQGQIAALLEAHRIRWVRVPDPDQDERMPDVGVTIAECPTCGPMDLATNSAAAHQASVLVLHLNKGRLRTASPKEASQPSAAPVHRLEVVISRDPRQWFSGDISFEGVCDAGEGAPCRMWCNDPDCREEAGVDHDRHVLVDQGECGVIGTLNADPGMIPELYRGPKSPLRPDFIELEQDIDGVTWRYAEETQPASDPGGCAPGCRHECPACRLGLVSHLHCDPRCEHREVAISQ